MTKVDHIKQNIFGLIFSIFALLTLILGNTFFSWYLIGLGSFGILFFSIKTKKKLSVSNQQSMFLWFLFLLVIGLSFFTTHSIPKTLDSFAFYSFSFLVFWFFIRIPKVFFSKSIFLKSIIAVASVLLITSLGISFFEPNSLSLPGMNLLYPTYGHNHLAAVILLLLPLSWWVYFEKKQENKLYFLLPLFLTLGLMLSFGRVVVFIGFLQLLYIVFFTKVFKKGKKPLKKSFKFLIFIFFILLSTKAVFSLASNNKLLLVCKNNSWLDKRLCKSITKESRPFYWGQAMMAVRDYPIFGYGAGTFSLISRKYAQLPYVTSSYTHNAFLKVFSELGFVGGGVFLFLMLRLLQQAGVAVREEKKQLKNNDFSFKKAALLGVVSIYFDVLFDFDWSFLGVFCLTLVLLALIIKNEKHFTTKEYFYNLEKQLVIFVSGVLVVLSFLFIGLEILTRTEKAEKAFELFPYFSTHQSIFKEDGVLVDSDILDPWSSLSNFQLKQLASDNDYEELNKRLLKIYNLLDGAWETHQYNIGYDKKLEFFSHSLEVADFLMLEDRYDEAVTHYVWVYKIEPWIFLFREIPLSDSVVDLEKMDIFLKSFTVVDKNNWVDHSEALSSLYKKQLNYEIEIGDLDSIDFYLNYFDQNIDLDYPEQLQIKARLQWFVNDLISDGDFENAEEVLKILVEDLNDKDYWGSDQLGNFYIYLFSKPELEFLEKEELVARARQAYVVCIDIFNDYNNPCHSRLEALVDERYDPLIYGEVSKILFRRGDLVE